MNREMLYNDLSGFLAMHFPCKVQKISINAGFTCPNRDGLPHSFHSLIANE